MLKLKWFILFSLWATLATAEEIQCKGEFVKEPPLLQTSSELSQQNTRLKSQVQTSSHRWMSFEEAKAVIRKVGLTSLIQFQQWSKSGKRPEDFPANPHRTYKEEWTGWGDFLGAGNISTRKKEFMNFEEAQTFIRNEGVQTRMEFEAWKRSGKRPEDFPSAPEQTYKEEWGGWGDFLGTGNMAHGKKEFMSFEEAKTFIQNEGIQTSAEFQKWKREGKRPAAFPSTPNKVYEEWIGWGDFLGTGNMAHGKKEFMSFEEAQTFIRSEGIQTSIEFEEWKRSGKRPEDFPANPPQIYEDKWTGWGDFLGTGNMAHGKKAFMSFEEAQIFIRSEGIQTRREFEAWKRSGKRPRDFPSAPDLTYKEEWAGWGNFLGTGNIGHGKKEFMSFEEAEIFIRNEGIQTRTEFEAWKRSGKRPRDFPSAPDLTYKEEWTGWGNFLGEGNISTRKKEFMSFEEAQTFIQNKGFTSKGQFEQWRKSGEKPEDFPSSPERTYKKEWTDWGDFLGTGSISTSKRKFMSFEEAQAFIWNEGIQTRREFDAWKRSGKRPEDFPSAPDLTYKEEWAGWGDFLGTGNISHGKKEFMSFEEAQTFIWSEGIQSRTEFEVWSREGKRPEDFPANPPQIYKDKWTGWSDFLGVGNISSKRQEWISKAWKKSGKRSENFPGSSARTNKDKWTIGGLGVGNMAHGKKEFMSFEEAQAFIRNEGIQTRMEFEAWKRSGKRPANFPSSPEQTYKEEWTGWDDFLGTGNISTREEVMNFEEAKKYVQTLRFDQPRDFIEWLKSSDRPIHFPPNPHQFYSEWISVKDFLSTEKYVSYKEAKTFVQSMAITNLRDFLELMRDEPDIFPDNFPPNPNLFYSKTGDWIDWNDFLGITDKSKNKAGDHGILNREDFQNEEMEEDNFVDV